MLSRAACRLLAAASQILASNGTMTPVDGLLPSAADPCPLEERSSIAAATGYWWMQQHLY
jgi:hypothetical protein